MILPKEDYFTRALYTFDIGQNDLTAGYKLNMTIQQVEDYVPDLMTQLSNAIKVKKRESNHKNFIFLTAFLTKNGIFLCVWADILQKVYAQGGRSFWVHNTGPVGCLPYVLDRFLVTAAQVNKFGCATPFNDVAQYFNSRLKETIDGLRKVLPLAAITYVDVYSVKYNLITRAKKYGNISIVI